MNLENIPEFQELSGDLSTEEKIFGEASRLRHIKDPALKVIYSGLKDTENHYKVLKLGEKILAERKEKLPILEAIYQAASYIVEEFKTHPGGNIQEFYDNQGQAYFENLKEELHKKIHELRKQGIVSDIFSTYRAVYEKEMDAAVEDFLK